MSDSKVHNDFTYQVSNLKFGEFRNEYRGRNFYVGPAIVVDTVDEMIEVIRNTTCPITWDNMGRGFIVHPKR